jgi:hypothetical protein
VQVARLKKRFSEVASVDFFGAPRRKDAEALVSEIEKRVAAEAPSVAQQNRGKGKSNKPTAATWVTRKGIHVDRMASAWLVRRFIDTGRELQVRGGERLPAEARRDSLRHVRCRVHARRRFMHVRGLLGRFALAERSLRAIGEIVHDIDLKDRKFAREETPGIAQVIAGIAMANKEDDDRLSAAGAVWDGLYEYFRRKGE